MRAATNLKVPFRVATGYGASSERGLAARIACVILIAMGSLLLSSCYAVEERGPWKVRWRVELTERIHGGGAMGVLTLTPEITGEETWWVSDQALVIDSRGSGPSLGQGRSRMWILPAAGWVYTEDLNAGNFTRTPIARWNEERRRQSRAATIETIRRQATLRNPESLAYFLGDLRLRAHDSGERQGWHALAAVPGRLWNLRGNHRYLAVWKEALLPLGFDGVSEDRRARLQPILAGIAPSVIEEVALPEDERLLTMARIVENVVPQADFSLAPEVPAERIRALEVQEPGLDDAETLWRLFGDAGARPAHIDQRAIRFQLAGRAAATFVPRILARLDAVVEVEECEELLHLLFDLDRAQYDRRLAEARARGDLTQILAAVSVSSLRDARDLDSLITELVEHSPQLWENLESDDAEEARIWLQGVQRWVAATPAAPTRMDSAKSHAP